MQQAEYQADWLRGQVTVEQEGAVARADFIRKTYIHLLVGLMAFCGVTYAIMQSPLMMTETGPGILLTTSPWVFFGLLMGVSFVYPRMFASANLNTHYIAFGLVIVVEAIVCSPLFYLAQYYAPGENILRNAFFLTAAGFGGLTAFVLLTKKDFSFMGGFLSIATLVLIGVSVIGYFAGWDMGLGLSAIVILVFGGWVLHDTSKIQRHLPLNGYVYGATILLISFVVILRQVVWILMASRD